MVEILVLAQLHHRVVVAEHLPPLMLTPQMLVVRAVVDNMIVSQQAATVRPIKDSREVMLPLQLVVVVAVVVAQAQPQTTRQTVFTQPQVEQVSHHRSKVHQ
jgi:chaperone required for assembly of F1-ATPase